MPDYIRHLICITVFTAIYSSQAELIRKLLHYETLELRDVTSRVKRDIRLPLLDEYQEVKFFGFGRHFHLELTKSKIVSPGLRVNVIHHDGQMSKLPLPHSHFYNGKLKGEIGTNCTISIEDGVMTGSIQTEDDHFFIEPLWRHVTGVHRSNSTMLMYRKSDVNWNSTRSHCSARRYAEMKKDTANENVTQNFHAEYMEDVYNVFEERKARVRRNTLGNRKVCRILLVADHYFYNGIGGGYMSSTMTYMISLMDNVNNIFTSTQWSGDLSGAGFEIAGIYIHDSFTPEKSYNVANRNLGISALLEEFSKAYYRNNYCLIHLLTYQSFAGNLGMSYVASWRPSDQGGICSPSDDVGRLTANAGVSSSMNTDGERQLSLVAMATVTHELAHSWGSEHDPDTDECFPSVQDGGLYLMLDVSQPILFKNNLKFSPCSKRSVHKVLEAKGYNCFNAERTDFSVCGNGRLDNGEICDSGTENDACCENCQPRPGALCSPQNFPCCVNCTLAPLGFPCFFIIDDNTDCRSFAVCNGMDYTCPQPGNKPDGTACIDGGTCQSGVCVDFCRSRGQLSCLCSSESGKACHRCCKDDVPDAPCQAYDEYLRDGSYCEEGACQAGACVKSASLIARTWNVILTEITDSFAIFMRNNVVLFTFLFTAIAFLPFVIAIHVMDNKSEKNDKDIREAFVERRDEVVLSSAKPMITRVEKPINLSRKPRSNNEDKEPLLLKESDNIVGTNNRWHNDVSSRSNRNMAVVPPSNMEYSNPAYSFSTLSSMGENSGHLNYSHVRDPYPGGYDRVSGPSVTHAYRGAPTREGLVIRSNNSSGYSGRYLEDELYQSVEDHKPSLGFDGRNEARDNVRGSPRGFYRAGPLRDEYVKKSHGSIRDSYGSSSKPSNYHQLSPAHKRENQSRGHLRGPQEGYHQGPLTEAEFTNKAGNTEIYVDQLPDDKYNRPWGNYQASSLPDRKDRHRKSNSRGLHVESIRGAPFREEFSNVPYNTVRHTQGYFGINPDEIRENVQSSPRTDRRNKPGGNIRGLHGEYQRGPPKGVDFPVRPKDTGRHPYGAPDHNDDRYDESYQASPRPNRTHLVDDFRGSHGELYTDPPAVGEFSDMQNSDEYSDFNYYKPVVHHRVPPDYDRGHGVRGDDRGPQGDHFLNSTEDVCPAPSDPSYSNRGYGCGVTREDPHTDYSSLSRPFQNPSGARSGYQDDNNHPHEYTPRGIHRRDHSDLRRFEFERGGRSNTGFEMESEI